MPYLKTKWCIIAFLLYHRRWYRPILITSKEHVATKFSVSKSCGKFSDLLLPKAQKCCDKGKCSIYCSFLTQRRSIPLVEDRWTDNIRGVLSRSSFARTTSCTDPDVFLLSKYMWLGKAFARQRRAQFFGFHYYWRRKMPKFCGIQNVLLNVVNIM